jgi:YgiT-type zinc finger domain-containing protein
MKVLCPNCEQEQEVSSVVKYQTFTVKGQNITVQVKGYICSVCGEFIAEANTDELEEAYKLYEKQTGINPRYQGSCK